MIRVIAFDLDDTLWDVNTVIFRAEKLLNTWFSDRVPGFDYDMRNMGRFRHEVVAKEPHLAGRVTDLRYRVIEKALSAHGVGEADSIAREAMELFLEARNQIEFFEGALETIATVAREYQLGALTNGNADIKRLGLSEFFSFAFSAEDVGAPKPAPDLFHAALEHTGCEPVEMVYVGDDPIKDIDTANTVGLRTVWLSNERRPGPGETEPDEVIGDISELPVAIRKLQSLE